MHAKSHDRQTPRRAQCVAACARSLADGGEKERKSDPCSVMSVAATGASASLSLIVADVISLMSRGEREEAEGMGMK